MTCIRRVRAKSFDAAGKYVMKNADCLLVHGLVSSFDLAEMPYAWVKKGDKVYHAEHDKWYTGMTGMVMLSKKTRIHIVR